MPHGPKEYNIQKKQYGNTFNKDFKNGPHKKTKTKTKNPRSSLLPVVETSGWQKSGNRDHFLQEQNGLHPHDPQPL